LGKRILPAIVVAWYPGQRGGTALADVLFGDVSPSGRLPVTFYKASEKLPPFDDYTMQGRTYRYFGGQALYPFGHGLVVFAVRVFGLRLDRSRSSASGKVTASLLVRNAGKRAATKWCSLCACDGVEGSASEKGSARGDARDARTWRIRQVTFEIDAAKDCDAMTLLRRTTSSTPSGMKCRSALHLQTSANAQRST
jgi:beta-glucosidase